MCGSCFTTSFIHPSMHASLHEFWSCWLRLATCCCIFHLLNTLKHAAKVMQAIGHRCPESSVLNVILQDSLLSRDMRKPTAESAHRRTSYNIIGRHPDTPSEVPVVFRQLTGTLLLRDCFQQLRIRYNGSEVAPPDFQAAAGCSKSKNWKVPNPEPLC